MVTPIKEVKSVNNSRTHIPANAKYIAEERCEKNKVEYNEAYEKELREIAADCLLGII